MSTTARAPPERTAQRDARDTETAQWTYRIATSRF